MRYTNLGSMISVDITDRYSVAALINSDKDKHTLTLYLHRNDIPTFDLIEEVENMILPAVGKENIKMHVCDFIEKCWKNKMFNKYITRFEYQQQCFDIGSEVLNEQERAESK